MVALLIRALATWSGARITAQMDGISWTNGFSRHFARWDEVTDYYLEWPGGRLPGPNGKAVRPAKIDPGDWPYLPMPRDEELAVTVLTVHGRAHLEPGFRGRELLRSAIQRRATSAAATAWEAVEYRLPGGVREFSYRVPGKNEIWNQVVANSPFKSGFWLLNWDTVPIWPGLGLDFVLGLSAVACGKKDFEKFRNVCLSRLDDRIIVTEAALIWRIGDETIELGWNEICSLASETVTGEPKAWIVRTGRGQKFRFYPEFMPGGQALPAIIYKRSPLLCSAPESESVPIRASAVATILL